MERNRQRKARHDQRRPNARARGYDSRWDKARKGFLRKHPYCEMCKTPATVVDHIKPHRGDRTLFWDRDNWQPLCSRCHSSLKQSSEHKAESSLTHPFIDTPPTCKVTIITGAPGSGKSHYVQQHAKAGDVMLDLDEIKARLAGTDIYRAPDSATKPALEQRNEALKALHTLPSSQRIWFILSDPISHNIETWARKLNAEVIEIEATLEQCLSQIEADPRRQHDLEKHRRICRWWFKQKEKADA